ncbi:hypothetical protein OCOL_000490 [Ordospora colligata]|uniref:Mitochondrial import inner membrane translocase subunit TIM50 n=1 Tax=Ordospora colligata OC4 TaxID=1354746 RepID=A0A0B2UM01_9MICR|nr:uncharacterized protein M896_010190 [Ordospora colligata OC4]KHN70368.1 hypothetical protein M896_010190 [Ordospora colligata OC4]
MNAGKYLIVFDINGTLIKRYRKYSEELKRYESMGIVADKVSGAFAFYDRPHLDVLLKFLKTHEVSYILWTTGMEKNAKIFVEHLESLGFDEHIGSYSQIDCKAGKYKIDSSADLWVKDLDIVAKDHGFDVERCILVDDSLDKSLYNQNLICCKEYDPENYDDDGIMEICRYLDAFIGCTKECIMKMMHNTA